MMKRIVVAYGRNLGVALVFVILVVVPISFLILIDKAAVSGEELSRDTLQRRSFRYFELPYFRRQISGITRTSISNDLVTYLTDNNLIGPRQENPGNWDLVYGHRGSTTTYGEAAILSQYLTAGGNPPVWLEWSKKNPELARVLWPEIVSAVRDEMYFVLPDLFRLATEIQETSQLQSALNDSLADGYLRRAVILEKLGNRAIAERLFASALKFRPDDTNAKLGLERTKRST